ncbi:MAG: hypothetical protein QW702_02715 [Candidatus Bathyarchaeia archaeon]
MPYTCVCLKCGKEFISDRPRKFCSLECFFEYKRKLALENKMQFLKKVMEVEKSG